MVRLCDPGKVTFHANLRVKGAILLYQRGLRLSYV